MGFTALITLIEKYLKATYDMNDYHDVMIFFFLPLFSVSCLVFGISASASAPVSLMVTIFGLSYRQFPIELLNQMYVN